MDCRIFSELLVPFMVLLLGSQLVNGFATDKCSHEELTGQIVKTIKCSDYSNNKLVDVVMNLCMEIKETKDLERLWIGGCQVALDYLTSQMQCAIPMANNCFDDKITGLVSEAATIFEENCASQNVFEIFSKLQRNFGALAVMVQKELAPSPMQHLATSFKFDKQCSLADLGKKMSNALGCIDESFEWWSNNPYPKPSACSTLDETLKSCLKPNRCVSEREIGLIRELMYTTYHEFMKTLVKSHSGKTTCNFKDILGGDDMKDTMKMLNGHWDMSELGTRFGQDSSSIKSKIIDMMIKDYKTESCQNKLREFSFIPLNLDPSIPLNPNPLSNLDQSFWQ